MSARESYPFGPRDVVANFGALNHLLPEGYAVVWFDSVEHYMAIYPDGEESPIHWDRWTCLRWCRQHKSDKRLAAEEE